MNVLMGLILMFTGAFLVIRHRHLVDFLTSGTERFRDLDSATSSENLIIIGSMMIVSGVALTLM